MKFPIRFYCALGVSAAFRVILTKISKRSGNAVQWNGGITECTQREITPKLSAAELWFLCMTHRLIVLYICMKFHFNSFNGCHLTEQT